VPREIARMKRCPTRAARVHHVPHGAQQHKVSPRAIKPTKPQTREFCGKCHGKDAKDKLAKNAPKIDLAEHGEKYVCWQCHYPIRRRWNSEGPQDF